MNDTAGVLNEFSGQAIVEEKKSNVDDPDSEDAAQSGQANPQMRVDLERFLVAIEGKDQFLYHRIERLRDALGTKALLCKVPGT